MSRGSGWRLSGDGTAGRGAIHVAVTDDQATDDVVSSGGAERRTGFALSNRVLDETVAQTGYYGRDAVAQRERLQPHDLQERIDLGQMLIGSPDTVLQQIRQIQSDLGAGILDLIFQPVGRDKTLRALELFGTQVLPRMHEL